MSYRKAVLKHFSKFTERQLYNSFLIKLYRTEHLRVIDSPVSAKFLDCLQIHVRLLLYRSEDLMEALIELEFTLSTTISARDWYEELRLNVLCNTLLSQTVYEDLLEPFFVIVEALQMSFKKLEGNKKKRDLGTVRLVCKKHRKAMLADFLIFALPFVLDLFFISELFQSHCVYKDFFLYKNQSLVLI